MKKVVLVSNEVMHYRVPVYNYFWRRFRDHGWEFMVRSNALQRECPYATEFDFAEIPLEFGAYRREIARIDPDAVITFLRLKDLMVWPFVHWLRARGTPVAFWMKAMNYDDPGSLSSRLMYKYMHALVDGLILYSVNELPHIAPKNRHKAFPANNTLNFESFPVINASKEEIKREFDIPFEKIVLSVGRMGAGGQRKKVHQLIDIFRETRTPGAGLVIVGSGVTDELRAAMNPANTRYLGEVHDPDGVQISKVFKMADVFAIPGHVGLGLNQAFYWGLPVVTGDFAQPPEIHYLVHGRNGFIVPSDDRQALEDRLMELLTDDRKRAELSANARQDILKNASIDGMFQGFRSCVESMAAPALVRA